MLDRSGLKKAFTGVDLRGGLARAAELGQVDDSPAASLQLYLAIAGHVGGGDHLAGDGEALVDVLR